MLQSQLVRLALGPQGVAGVLYNWDTPTHSIWDVVFTT